VLGSSFKSSTFDFNHDLDRVDARLSSTLNANVADLSDFARRGGKLLLYTGIADPAVPVGEVVNYYDRVAAAAGGPSEAARFARLFLVPGMGHCFGGPGVTNIGQLGEAMPATPENDILMQLVAWTEGGEMPEQIVARKPAGATSPAQERPICAYPALPDYRGGDPAKAARFACTAHARGAVQTPASRYIN
jgi:feruloyl esterase